MTSNTYYVELSADEVQAITFLLGDSSFLSLQELINKSYLCDKSVSPESRKFVTEFNNNNGLQDTYQKFAEFSKKISEDRKPKTKEIWVVVLKDHAGLFSHVFSTEEAASAFVGIEERLNFSKHISTTKQTVGI